MDSYSEEDTDINDYWDESDNDNFDEENDFIYQPEETSLSKFNIVLCEKYNRLRHGPANKEMNSHYLTYTRFKQLNMDIIRLFRLDSNTLKLEMAQCIYLPSEHCVSIIKTFWLKLIQRKWKNIFKERKLCVSRRCNPNAIRHREIHGRWPNNCLIYPSLNGMLSELSRSSSRCAST